jgi:hypothetical protein
MSSPICDGLDFYVPDPALFGPFKKTKRKFSSKFISKKPFIFLLNFF